MNSDKIRVVHTVLNLGFAGLERVVTELSLNADRNLFDVEVCCFHRKGYFADILEKAGIAVTILPQKQTGVDYGYVWKLSRFFRQRAAQVVHAHTGTFIFSALAGKLARVPAIVYTDHGRFLVEPKVRLVEDYISARLADRSVAVSAELFRYMIDRVKFPAAKMTTIVNGVNTETFAPRPRPPKLLNEFGLSAETRILGCVASFIPVKDHLTMLKALTRVTAQLPGTVLFLVGDGPLRRAIEESIVTDGLAGRVVLTGKRQDVPDLLNLFDLFLLSSLSEGTSMSIAEAMASGVPIVATDVGGNRSIVDHGLNGLLVRPGRPEEMAEAILALLRNDERRSSFAREAVEKIKREYSAQVMASRYADLYLDILRRKGQNL